MALAMSRATWVGEGCVDEPGRRPEEHTKASESAMVVMD
jgi:hypothetical protein